MSGIGTYVCSSAIFRDWFGSETLLGLLLSVDGPRTDVSDVTHYAYYLSTDESGCGTVGGACHRAGDLALVTDPLGHARKIPMESSLTIPIRQEAGSKQKASLAQARLWTMTR